MPNVNDIMRQAQIMQRKIEKMQGELAEKTFESTSGGGMVKAVVNGNHQVVSLTIDPKVVEGGDVEMLQDLIVAALNEAERIAHETMEREVSSLSGNFKLPKFF